MRLNCGGRRVSHSYTAFGRCWERKPRTTPTVAEVSRISGEVRDIVREEFTPQPVDLPPDFPFSEFKAIGSGANQVIALPIQVSDSPLPTGRIQNLDENFA